jgi:hypothetical protein
VRLVRVVTPEPASSPTAACSESVPGPDFQVFPQVLDGLSCTWPRAGALATTVSPDAGHGSGWDIVDEWGLQSFPASDPPANW